MNLHEECLLKYLSNPSELSLSTELLKQYNEMLVKADNLKSILAKPSGLSYITNRT